MKNLFISFSILILLSCGKSKSRPDEKFITNNVASAINNTSISNSNKFLGNILRGTGVLPGEAYSDPLFSTYWDQATPENNGKWRACEFNRDSFTWAPLDEHYNFSINNNIKWKNHAFIWGSSIPDWLPLLNSTDIKAEIIEWIQAYFSRYPSTMLVDVVNEPINAPPPTAVINALGGSTNYEWVVEVFRIAKQYKPAHCKLILNEYNVLKTASLRTTYKTIIQRLVNENLIDGIGCQGHFLESVSAIDLKNRLDDLSSSGIPIYITEYDINKSIDSEQELIMSTQFPVIWEHENVAGVTLWGYKQNETWKPNTHLIRTNGTDRPAFTWLKNYFSQNQSITAGNYKIENKSFSRRLKLSEVTVNNVVTSGLNGSEQSIKWSLEYSGSYVTLRNALDNRYLKRSNGGTNVVTGCCVDDYSKWEILFVSTGYYRLKNKATGEFLDADSTDWNVKANSSSSGDDKLWKFVSL